MRLVECWKHSTETTSPIAASTSKGAINMMTHEWCQQSNHCWLNGFFSDEFHPEPPRFRIGQVVQVAWIDDDDRERIDTARIYGIMQSCPGYLLIPGWWYIVRVTHQDGRVLSYRPSYEEVHESDLREVS